MRELRLRDLYRGPAPGPDRILYSNLWFDDHNNQRYEQLLPRLERIDAYLLHASSRRIPRGVEYRAWRGPLGTFGQRVVARRASRRYRGMFSTEYRQLATFPGPVVVDVDDTSFSEHDLALFRRPNVIALVTTSPWAAERFASLGVTAPVHVVPQGVTLRGATEPARPKTGPVVAYTAARLLASGDPGGDNPLYNAEHLLELWDEIHGRVPDAQLWLVGTPGPDLERRLGGRGDVVLFGRVPRERVIPILAQADLALYVRRVEAGLAVVKISDYLAAGLPVVSYDEPRVAAQLGPTGAGVLASTEREFVDAAARLLRDGAGPQREAARRAGAELDWDVLAKRYEAEILDRYLPGAGPREH